MRFKYYLRGIGIGVTLATLLLTISFYFGRDTLTKEKLTDEEIITRATALGMVMPEEEVTAEDEQVPMAGPEESVLVEEGNDDSETSEKDDAVEAEAEETVTAKSKVEEEKKEYTLEQAMDDAKNVTKETDTSVTYVPFKIKGGESSEVICNNLYKAGLVDSDKEFNKYLNKLNVDNVISTGTFYIPTNSSYDDIVALLVDKSVRTTSLPEGEKPPKAPDKPSTPKAGQ